MVPQYARSRWIALRMGKVVVGSGWWCDGKRHDWAIGSPFTRSVAFFDIWYRQVMRCLNPDRVVITDSASPIKPDFRSYPIEWIELDRNYGHPNDIRVGRICTKYSGFTRTVISGAMRFAAMPISTFMSNRIVCYAGTIFSDMRSETPRSTFC